MEKNKLYVLKSGALVGQDHYIAFVHLLKVLFRCKIINEDIAIELALEFRPFIV